MVGVGSTLVAVGAYRPQRRVTNAELLVADRVSDEWVRDRTGIIARRHAGPAEGLVEMARDAARAALLAGEVAAGEVDAIAVATCSRCPRVFRTPQPGWLPSWG